MRFVDPEKRAAIALYAVVAVLAVTSAGLAIAIALEAGRGREVVLVGGPDGQKIVRPGTVSDELVRDFAELYIVRFENFTPATIPTVARRLPALVAPSQFHTFEEILNNRAKLAEDSGLVSQLALDRREPAPVVRDGGRIVVELVGFRRLYVADRLTQESHLRYRITMELGEPVEENPYGLYVTGHRAEPMEEGAPR